MPEGDTYIHPKSVKSCICAEVLKSAYEHSSTAIVKELKTRNHIFDENLKSVVPDIEIYRSSESSITSVLTLPDNMPGTAYEFCVNAYYDGVKLSPIVAYAPDNFSLSDSLIKKIRISVGALDATNIAEGAKYMGSGINHFARIANN